MTLQEAYLKAKSVNQTKGFTLLSSCTDYGEFWGFSFNLPNFDEDDIETYIIGKGPTTVNKKTGALEQLGSGRVPGLPQGKPIPVEQFAEYNVAV